MSHFCKAPGCHSVIADHLLLCGRHWQKLPLDVKDRLYAAYDQGRGRGSEAHLLSIQEAVESLLEKESAR